VTLDRISASVSGKTAVVFGGAGFVGSHLTERLIDAGASVVAVDNGVTGRWSNLAGIGDTDSLRTIDHDVTRPFSVDGPVDFVLNLASPASPLEYLRLPLETLRAGSIGTENSLELALTKGARFLVTSTSEVYGEPAVPSTTRRSATLKP
jgi:dTDP-glucose 4,6-dehydratase